LHLRWWLHSWQNRSWQLTPQSWQNRSWQLTLVFRFRMPAVSTDLLTCTVSPLAVSQKVCGQQMQSGQPIVLRDSLVRHGACLHCKSRLSLHVHVILCLLIQFSASASAAQHREQMPALSNSMTLGLIHAAARPRATFRKESQPPWQRLIVRLACQMCAAAYKSTCTADMQEAAPCSACHD
jgi:hypothetical protein